MLKLDFLGFVIQLLSDFMHRDANDLRSDPLLLWRGERIAAIGASDCWRVALYCDVPAICFDCAVYTLSTAFSCFDCANGFVQTTWTSCWPDGRNTFQLIWKAVWIGCAFPAPTNLTTCYQWEGSTVNNAEGYLRIEFYVWHEALRREDCKRWFVLLFIQARDDEDWGATPYFSTEAIDDCRAAETMEIPVISLIR